MSVAELLALCLALVVGTLVGWVLSRRRGRPATPPAAPPDEAPPTDEASRLRREWKLAHEEKDRAIAGETLCRRIIDTTLDGVAVLDGDCRIERWNPQAAAIFGWDKDEAIGKPLLPLIVAEKSRAELQRVISGRARLSDTPLFSRRNEMLGRRKNGQEFPLEIAVTPLLQPEKGVSYSVFLRDISERKRVERLKNEFVSTVSHELRTPLTAIRGSLRLIAGGFTGELPAKTRTMINIANESCERLVTLVNDILDVEKIESGKVAFNLRLHDAGELAGKAVDATRAFAQPFGVEIRAEAPSGPCLAMMDADRIIQVMTNLISNAVKFSPKGECIRVRVTPRGGRVRVEVADRGPGIPEDFRPRVFQKFAQADASNDRCSQPGTGLGLSICKAIVERLGGSIGFDTAAGRGTTFWFEIPAEELPPAPDEPASSVLIVEDDPASAELIAAGCRSTSMKAEVASTASAARARLSKGSFAALILDLEMSDVSGFSFLREIRADARLRSLPVIVVTTRREDTGRFPAGDDLSSIVDWIQKPIDGSQVQSALRNIAAAGRDPRAGEGPGDAVRNYLRRATAAAAPR